MSRKSIKPALAARTSRLCCHAMPALQTGHLVLYQTVSCGLISNLTVESNNTIAARAGRAQRRDGYSRFATSSSMTSVAPPPMF
jgi:hypothetical protein